ncbi:Gamma-glutamylaminecyclotransferase [Phytophthora citrophthora]|uniref:Gamma-glutamylcyclotransferase family protein n=1 Tax=Phytophthora citrophthora TaxID=4793 RepID=A0AAD9GVI6_9STRA|nr:Gamma-glutamylaminecyclotransferase [Phytophthora citrophthora]
MSSNEGSNWTRVFVYGTLKTGLYNYKTYLQPAIELGKASFVGGATTSKEEFHMVLDDQAFYPCLYRAPKDEGYRVIGEVYSVDNDTLAALDVLEEVDDGLYARDDIEVDLVDGERKGQTVSCQVYLMPVIDDLPRLERITNYTAVMNAKYDQLMGDPQLEILECIYGKEVTQAVEAKVKGGMEFEDAWKVVVKA